MRYDYWLLRYVPNTVRGEFVNIGVLAGADGHDWALRRVFSFTRASRLGGDASLASDWLNRLSERVKPRSTMFGSFSPGEALGIEGISTYWIERQQGFLNNAVQIAAPVPVEAESAQKAADMLFDVLVLENPGKGRIRRKARIISDLQYEYLTEAHLKMNIDLRPRVKAIVGAQSGTFDFAVGQNQVRQLTQVWSFGLKDLDRVDQDVRAWSYLVGRIRDEGGRVTATAVGHTKRTLEISPDVPVRVVYERPETDTQKDHFRVAQDAWSKLGVVAFPTDQMGRVASEARRLVEAR